MTKKNGKYLFEIITYIFISFFTCIFTAQSCTGRKTTEKNEEYLFEIITRTLLPTSRSFRLSGRNNYTFVRSQDLEETCVSLPDRCQTSYITANNIVLPAIYFTYGSICSNTHIQLLTMPRIKSGNRYLRYPSRLSVFSGEKSRGFPWKSGRKGIETPSSSSDRATMSEFLRFGTIVHLK